MAAWQTVFTRKSFLIQAIKRTRIRPVVGTPYQNICNRSDRLFSVSESSGLTPESCGNDEKTSEPSSTHPRKIFVGNLRDGKSFINSDTLKDYFSNYGEIERLELLRRKSSKEPRGFAFIIFKSAEVAKKVLLDPHTIGELKIDVALPREKAGASLVKKRQRTVLVSNIAKNTGKEQIIVHFSQFDDVEEVILAKKGQEDGEPDSYYVIFSTFVGAKRSLQEPLQKIAEQSEDSQVTKFPEMEEFYSMTRKIRVVSASRKITLEALKEYFENFGELLAIDVIASPFNRFAGESIVGFVKFAGKEIVDEIAKNRVHVVDGVEVTVMKTRDSGNKRMFENDRRLKMAIEGLPPAVEYTDVRQYFNEVHGFIPNAIRLHKTGFSDQTNLCIVDFATKDQVDAILQEPNPMFQGIPVQFRRLSWQK